MNDSVKISHTDGQSTAVSCSIPQRETAAEPIKTLRDITYSRMQVSPQVPSGSQKPG